MSAAMVTVPAATEQARRRYDRHAVAWAVAAAGGTDRPGPAPALDLPLHPPSEAAALADEAAAVHWVRSWREARVPGLVWGRRRWASLGSQDVPERLRIADPADLATFAGRTRHWRTLSARADALVVEWLPTAAAATDATTLATAVRRHARAVTDLDEADFIRLAAVLRWLVAHPGSGLYIRQLPVRGVDTKWVGRHRGLVSGLLRAITGAQDLGLASAPELIRVRFLDLALASGGLTDVAAPVAELATLEIRPDVVLVFENLESVVAMPDLPGAVVVHGSGYAVDRLRDIPWVRDGRVLYWGDLDSHGFAILDRLRDSCPQARSVLMDEETLESHRDLWVPEPSPSRATPGRLTAAEQSALVRLRVEGDVRLEQERLDWRSSVERLRSAVRDGGSSTSPAEPADEILASR